MNFTDPQQRHAATLAIRLGMPSDSDWVLAWNRTAVKQREAVDVFLRHGADPEDLAHRFSIGPDEARPMLGFTFEVFGRIVDEPRTPLHWEMAPTGGLSKRIRIEVWRIEVPLGSALRALRTHDPLTGTDQKVVEVIGAGWESSIDRAKRGIRALEMKVTGGRPKGTTSPDPTFADRYYRALRDRYSSGFRDRPAQVDVAAELGESVDTLQRRIKDLSLSWPPRWPPE